ncbi:MAG: undecaprenyl-diphosphate phosphatase [Phaeodactylibacter sp.]|nr:undecaprenyl-diphosphate phosphatase [Phaeodactylibacter sp.]MCB9273249.1 undecaprenyl-diphosphate phosphatase [Lewinellaceae bacterium]
MEAIIRSAVLGIIQGLTEFLPVSSSGHLELAKYFLGDTSVGEESLLMTVALHAATALSTIVVFRKDLADIFKGLFQFRWNEETQYSLKIVLSMIPAAVVGLLFESQIEELFNQRVVLVSLMLGVTGLLLLLAGRSRPTDKPVGYLNAFLVGIAQAIAIMPGISRSGATISTSVLLGIGREQAARFSFLMVVPLILGKMAKSLMDGELAHTSIGMAPLAVGFAAAFITGILACMWMIKLVKNSKLAYFSVYCFLIAAIAIIAFYLNQ